MQTKSEKEHKKNGSTVTNEFKMRQAQYKKSYSPYADDKQIIPNKKINSYELQRELSFVGHKLNDNEIKQLHKMMETSYGVRRMINFEINRHEIYAEHDKYYNRPSKIASGIAELRENLWERDKGNFIQRAKERYEFDNMVENSSVVQEEKIRCQEIQRMIDNRPLSQDEKEQQKLKERMILRQHEKDSFLTKLNASDEERSTDDVIMSKEEKTDEGVTKISDPFLFNYDPNEKVIIATVKEKGISLWQLSENFYGSGVYYNEIADFNNITDPDLIYIDQKIKLPFIKNLNETEFNHYIKKIEGIAKSEALEHLTSQKEKEQEEQKLDFGEIPAFEKINLIPTFPKFDYTGDWTDWIIAVDGAARNLVNGCIDIVNGLASETKYIYDHGIVNYSKGAYFSYKETALNIVDTIGKNIEYISETPIDKQFEDTLRTYQDPRFWEEFLTIVASVLATKKMANIVQKMKIPAATNKQTIAKSQTAKDQGTIRGKKWGPGWQKASLEKAIQRHAGPKYTKWKTNSGKIIYENPLNGRQVVVDKTGGYFRIFQPKTIGGKKGTYLNLLGKEVTPSMTTKSGIKSVPLKSVSKELWQQSTHFIIE